MRCSPDWNASASWESPKRARSSRVVVARDIDEVAAQALERAGATYISGHHGPGYASSSLLVRAKDQASARKAIGDALGTHAFIREARAMPVFVHAVIAPEAQRAFEEAAKEDPRIGGVVENASTGQLEVYFELTPGDIARAFGEARGLYERVARAAGVLVTDPPEMSMSGFDVLMVGPSNARMRLAHAQQLLDSGEHGLAIVVAQTACEMLINEVLLTLVQPHVTDEVWPWMLGRIRNFTLIDKQTQELWYLVTGSKIQQEPFWGSYDAHVKRRHGIVHRGDSATADDARRSLERHVRSLTMSRGQRARRRPIPLPRSCWRCCNGAAMSPSEPADDSGSQRRKRP